jgi:hypothetical protein
VPEGHRELDRMCRHCGAPDARKLGFCSVCELAVCDHCGNVQYVRGERRIVHNACLRNDENSFSMIKFVK